MERISGTLLIGIQMFSQSQQHQCIAEATAKEQQCLVDYFAQLRPKRWQEWERKYSGLSTAQYIFLIMQDDLRFDDETIAAALNVKRTSVRSMRSRIKGREVKFFASNVISLRMVLLHTVAVCLYGTAGERQKNGYDSRFQQSRKLLKDLFNILTTDIT